MPQVEVIRVPGSRETNFFHRCDRIPCGDSFFFGGERGLVFTVILCYVHKLYCPLENHRMTTTTTACHERGLYRDKSYNTFVVTRTTSRYSCVPLYAPVSLYDRLHVTALYSFCQLRCPTTYKINSIHFPAIFSPFISSTPYESLDKFELPIKCNR